MFVVFSVCGHVKLHPLELLEHLHHPNEKTADFLSATINGKRNLFIPTNDTSITWINSPLKHNSGTKEYPTKYFGGRIQKCKKLLDGHFSEEGLQYSILKDAVIYRSGLIETKDFFYRSFTSFPFTTKKKPHIQKRQPDTHLKLVFPCFHMYSYLYYHQVIELGPLILAVPQNLRSQMTVLIHSANNMTLDFMKSIGIREDQLFVVGNKTIQADRVIITTPPIFAGYWPQALRAMKEKVLDFYNPPKVEPDLFVIVRRVGSRKVQNSKQMELALKEKFPWIDFVYHRDYGLQSQIEFWRRAKLVIGPTGNAFTNVVWMQNNTALVEFNREYCESAYIGIARDNGVKTYEMWFEGQKGFHGTMSADIPLVIESVRTALKDLGLRYE